MLDIVRKDKYLLPLITYTRSGLHDKVERNIFQSSKYNKGAPFEKESAITTFLSAISPRVHLIAFLSDSL